MRFIVELAESEISSVQVNAAEQLLEMTFSAAMAQPLEPGAASSQGYIKGLRLHWQLGSYCTGDETAATLAACMGRVSHARLLHSGTAVTQLHAPAHWSGPLQLQLSFANGVDLQIEALALECLLPPNAQFFEVYAC